MKEKEIKKGSLLSRWKNKKQQIGVIAGIEKAPDDAIIPLSYGQQQLWFLQQLYPDNPFYNYSEGYWLKGNLQSETLVKAIQIVCSCHDVLSSSYHNTDGDIIQKINDIAIEIPLIDLSEVSDVERNTRLEKISLSNASKQFDLSQAPLFSIVLVKKSSKEHLLLFTLHHIITDKWSMGVFREQLARTYKMLYENKLLGTDRPEVQYSDYAYWQKSQELDRGQLAYWKNKLNDAPSFLDIPTDFQRANQPSFKGALHTRVFSKKLSEEILGLAKKLQTTPYTFLLTVYQILLFRYSGQQDILVGSPISNRNSKILESLMGFFNDTVVLRNKISGSVTFIQLLKEVREDVLASFSNKDIPFDFLVKSLKPERLPNINPFFQVMFLYHAVPETPSFGPNLKLSHAPVEVGVSKFDLTLYISEDDGILSTTFEYATDLYKESTIERFQEFYQDLLEGVLENPNQVISEIPMQSSVEKKQLPLYDVLKPTLWSGAKGIHSIIEEQVRKNREKPAVSFKDESITYGQLNDRAEIIASKILEHTSNRNEIVGLCLQRSVEMIVGILAILKSGCAYLPLDPEYPQERIKFMLNDTGAQLVVTNDHLFELFDELPVKKITTNPSSEEGQDNILKWPEVNNTDLAYVIYTSGSTGKPKGVPISHDNILHSTLGRLSFYDEQPTSFLLLSSIAFDSSKAGIFWTLCTGGKLVISEERLEQDLDRVGEIIASQDVSHTLMLPSLYNMILQHAKVEFLTSLKTVIVAGEACSSQIAKLHFKTLPKAKLYNEYGPTEATVWCIAHQIQLEDVSGVIPIGRAVAGAEIILLDPQKNQVPYGAVGEIYIGGPGLAGNYLNRPELTDEAYLEIPISSSANKLYKTGDLAKLNARGNIEFLGRADHQVKIRGHRIELDEIKNAVLDDEMVYDAEVCVAQLNTSDQLFLYVLARADFDTQQLKKNLSKKLPNHMVPSRYVVIDDFPRLPNGKVDKKALLSLSFEEQIADETLDQGIALTQIQQMLVTIWKEILQIGGIGIHDNFFEIGGDSILSIQIIAKARKLGLNFSPNDLFEHQTIAALEVLILETTKEPVEEEVTIFGPVPLSPIQHWFFETHEIAPHYWNQAYSIKSPEHWDKASVKDATDYLMNQHDALRTVFEKKDGNWLARILECEMQPAFQHYDISGFDERSKNEKIKATLETIQTNLNLDEGPLFRCLYFEDCSAEYFKVFLLAHHLVIDMVSWRVILDDFRSFLSEGEKSYHSRTTSILQWGNYLADLASSDKIVEELDFWKAQVSSSIHLPVDFEKPIPIAEKNCGTKVYTLESQNTEALMSEANHSYSTKIDELLMTAVASTVSRWSGMNEISFAMERHGRETLGTQMDLSNTVGWFTSFFPINLKLSGTDDYERDIVAVKEKMRNIPNGGIGYGILKYLGNFLGDRVYPQIIFNFLGNNSHSDFEFLSEGVRHPDSERDYLIEINSFIDNGVLVMYWSYSTEHFLEKTIDALLIKFDSVLKEIIRHCTALGEGKFTPSDFPELGLDQEDLDGLLDSLDL